MAMPKLNVGQRVRVVISAQVRALGHANLLVDEGKTGRIVVAGHIHGLGSIISAQFLGTEPFHYGVDLDDGGNGCYPGISLEPIDEDDVRDADKVFDTLGYQPPARKDAVPA